MKYPKFLKDNLAIELVCPSFGCNSEPYLSRSKKAISNLEQEGFDVIYKDIIYSNISFTAHENSRYIEFMNSYINPKTHLLLSVGGGEFLFAYLDKINFEQIKQATPKWFMGYSDNTFITFLLTTICDIASIYGPNLSDFGATNLNNIQLDVVKLLIGEKLSFDGYPKYEGYSLKSPTNPYANYNLTEDKILITYPNSSLNFEGRIIGGCLDCLSLICGTKYDKVKLFIDKYKNDKIIWYLESCDLNLPAQLRTLSQLKYSGWFNHISGIIIGRPLISDEIFDLTLEKVVLHIFEEYKIPIIINADIGHIKPMIPIINGSYAKVTTINNNISIEMILKD
ncbi:MAG: LD-carboxypeptidase [Anaeroplasmataceae bacterium]